MDILGQLALVVLLDEERELAPLVRQRDGGVRTLDELALVVLERVRRSLRWAQVHARGDGHQGRLVVRQGEDEPDASVSGSRWAGSKVNEAHLAVL